MRLIWLVRSCLVEANASYGAVRERGDIDVQSAIGATRVLMCSLRLARGCHGDGVSETKARGGPVPELSSMVRDGTVSATQLSFTDILMCSLRLARLGSVLFLRLY